jgi:hypothetical protein
MLLLDFHAYRGRLIGALNSADASQKGTFFMQMACVRQCMYNCLPDFSSSQIPAREEPGGM